MPKRLSVTDMPRGLGRAQPAASTSGPPPLARTPSLPGPPGPAPASATGGRASTRNLGGQHTVHNYCAGGKVISSQNH